MPRLPPLQVSFDPVPIHTTRRVYIQNLVNLLHHAIRTRNQPQATKAWGILIRCEEVDWKTSWKWALPVFDLEIEAARRAEAGSSTQRRQRESEEVVDVWARKEKYLRRLLVSVSLIHRPEVLLTLILHLIETREYQRALDDLELYLMSYPYILSATLHSYAGLLCFYLSQPVTTRQFARHPIKTSHTPQAHPNSGTDSDSDDSTESDDSATRHPQHGRITAESLGMNERMLRNALGHFGKALAREKEVHALREGHHAADESGKVGEALGEGDVKDKLRMKHGTAKVAQTFIDEINSLLREEASDDEDGPAVLSRAGAYAEEDETEDDEIPRDGNEYPHTHNQPPPRAADSPPPTPSTVAGILSDIGLDDTIPATRASVRRNRDGEENRRERDEETELSDGDGSVYSELSIG